MQKSTYTHAANTKSIKHNRLDHDCIRSVQTIKAMRIPTWKSNVFVIVKYVDFIVKNSEMKSTKVQTLGANTHACKQDQTEPMDRCLTTSHKRAYTTSKAQSSL